MVDRNIKWYSGILCKLNGENVNFRAEIAFNEYHQGIITVYNVSGKCVKKLEQEKSNSAILRLENEEYISVFNFYIEQSFCKTNIIEEKPVCKGVQLFQVVIVPHPPVGQVFVEHMGEADYTLREMGQDVFLCIGFQACI